MNVFRRIVDPILYRYLERTDRNSLLEFAMKHQPEHMRKQMDSYAQRLASEVAKRTAMDYLDKMRLLHCVSCPQRFGLHRVEIEGVEARLCDMHYAQWQSRQRHMAAANT